MQFFKKLEIHGFKSFANKTIIEFHPGITVVVGPNGCGKSNVFDSIRWVLGEQSARSLRGARMGDVIFNGSGGQKAMGMARVTLTLNNRSRHIPIEFDEIEIARRLFRTGESEYLLNRAHCRLKDIVTQFMDTGIGTDSYSVLEQGKIDAIINSRPIERRAIFDEAAGISKYKARKDEALNKLRRTEDDLVRLTDLIIEVRRQANSLKRQANKAERYRELSASLRRLEMELLVRRFFHFRQNSATSEAAFTDLSGRVASLRDQLKAIEEEQMGYKSQADEVQQTIQDNQALNFELSRELQDTQGRIALIEQRASDSIKRREAVARQVSEIAQMILQLETNQMEYQSSLSRQESELAHHKEEYERRRAAYEALKGDSDAATEEISALRSEITTSTRSRMEKDNEIRVARVMEEKLAAELAESDAEIETLREAFAALESQRNTHREQSQLAETNRERLVMESAAARESFRATELELYNVSADSENARRLAQECQSRHDALSDLQANFEGYYRGVKEVMTAGQKGKLKGLIGVVTTLIEARREHETAIETALGGQAQDVVVESADDAKAAIRFLKETRVGRATFLPLDLVEGRENSQKLKDALNEKGVIGFATDLVKFDARLTNVVQHLLGNVLVVENLDVAIALERRGIRTRYVTLDGDMVSASGAMTGGSMKAAGLLNRTREVKELAGKLVDLRKREKDLGEKVQSLRQEVATLRESSEKLNRQAQAQEVEAARARKDFETSEQRLQEKAHQLSRLDQTRAGKEKDIAAHRLTQREGATLLETLSSKVDTLEQRLKEIEAGAGAKQQETVQAGQRAHEVMIALTTATERLSSLKERMTSAERDHDRLIRTRGDQEAEIQLLDEQDSSGAKELEDLKATLENLKKQQDELLGQITFENKRREVVHLDLRRLGERTQVLQRDYNEAQNEFHEMELRRTEFLVQQKNIRVQAQEKFGAELDLIVGHVLGLVRDDQLQAAQAAEAARQSSSGEPSDSPEGNKEASEPAGNAENPAGAETAADAEDAPSEAVLQFVMDYDNLPESATELLGALLTPEEIGHRIQELRGSIDALGPVHMGAIDEYNELNDRLEFLLTQEKDLNEAKTMLSETIGKIDETTKDLFSKAFSEIRANFEQVYRRLFNGGRADLILTDENGLLEGGIDIIAQPPGKKPQSISLLSGGEKALTAVALLFAIFMRKPSPFCILDEIDAPLDDKNIERFKELVREFSDTTQFIIITHNKQTMQLADTIYGVTMEEQGVSRVVSIKLEDAENHKVIKDLELEPSVG